MLVRDAVDGRAIAYKWTPSFERLCPAITNEGPCATLSVMPALVAGIHVLKVMRVKDMDGQNKSGHDGRTMRAITRRR